MKKTLKSILLALTALLLLSCFAPTIFALDYLQSRVVRIGYYHIEGFNVMSDDGSRSGYGYEVLQAMKLYNNWTYEYIGYDKGWADIQQMMLDGEIDLVISAVKTPDRMEKYDFSDRAVSQSGSCLMVKAGESPYVSGKYSSYNGMRIGFIENSSQIAATETFAAEKGFSYTSVFYKTSADLEKAILAGDEVDAIVTSNMRIINGIRRLELFAMQDVHAMVKKGNSLLLDEVNFALEQISLHNPGLYDALHNKYYSFDEGDKVFFTSDESEFIDECLENGTVLRVALPPNMTPYSYFDGDVPYGILYEISMEILRRTGLKVQHIIAQTDEEYRALVENKGVDIRLAARFDYNYAEKLGYTLTDPYYMTDVSRVTQKDFDGEIESIAVVSGSQIESHYLPLEISDESVVRFGSVAECIKAVLDGSCDAVYLYTKTAQEAVFNEETNRLRSVVMPKYTAGFCIGVREDIDARLASILQKASESLNDNDISKLVLKYTDYSSRPMSLLGVLYNNPLFFIAIVALLLIMIFIGVMLALMTNRRKLDKSKNIELLNALILAEEANKAKSVFMSRMSHEIRTPLNAIIGYNSISSQEISQAKNEAEYRKAAMKAMDCLSKCDIASKHLLTVINDVLDMSAIESGKIKIAHEPFDFKSTITSLTTMFFSQAKEKGVEFEVNFDTPTEEWFVGDQMRISQILTNILSNAVKFTPAGGSVRLSICQTDCDYSATHIHFEISDTGIGMSSEFLSGIWAPFEQADASISRRFGGTGLGLSITKNLVDLMGATIDVKSELDVGTTFTVDIALKRTKQPERDEIYDFSDIYVLVVDDDVSTCDYLKLLFNRSGVRCDTVTSGEKAVEAVCDGIKINNRYTVCIIDWHMPGIDGKETIKKIRELAGRELPIIVISAYDFSEIEPYVNEIGVDSFAAKPLFQSAVFDLLANISGKRRALSAKKPGRANFLGARVLLAEDNKMNMEIAKALLASWNLQVDEAWNGLQAVEAFSSAPCGTYKAILMDVHMPEMDGYHATQMIRSLSHGEGADIPIIAMTADVFAEDVAEAMAAGMNAHIGKPIEKKLLLATLQKYIESKETSN